MGILELFDLPDVVGDGENSDGFKRSVAGTISEMTFNLLCLRSGILDVCVPSHVGVPYDFVIFFGGCWLKIQVKTVGKKTKARGKGGRPNKAITVKSSSGRAYKSGDFDYLFATTGDFHLLIPSHEVVGRARMIVDGPKYARYRIEGDDLVGALTLRMFG
ncbi:hypothetical protein LCGC14_0517030 [marine sediment metagenome]|uniref:PD(D/E)XK endonuclease domain-containing protein n=1 Tax=marine sediment metagenome TaxID=412755 RepID=A0A0F9S4F4_9ZZZZ